MDYPALDILFYAVSFLVGAMIGSFLNVCVYRIPAEMSVIRPGSRCPKCEAPIAWYDNIPIVSWLVLMAKCRHCRAPIHWQYPLIELLTGLLFLALYDRFGLQLKTPVYMLIAAGLILATAVDLKYLIIPDSVSLPGIFLGLALGVSETVTPDAALFDITGPSAVPVFNSLLGAAIGAFFIIGLDAVTQFLLKKPGMGMGDAKLLGMLGACFGLYSVGLIVMFGSFIGVLFGVPARMIYTMRQRNAPDEKAESGETEEAHHAPTSDAMAEADMMDLGLGTGHMPFGPALSAAALIVMYFGFDNIVQGYLDFSARLMGYP
jgi:leader peptidase (prepilin peptidase)/N-methyltransferase